MISTSQSKNEATQALNYLKDHSRNFHWQKTFFLGNVSMRYFSPPINIHILVLSVYEYIKQRALSRSSKRSPVFEAPFVFITFKLSCSMTNE